MTKEEVIAAIEKCAEELGRTPKRAEVCNLPGITRSTLIRHFGGFREALVACQLPLEGIGHPVGEEDLLLDWVRLVRELKKVPNSVEYDFRGKFSVRPFTRLFGNWANVAPELFKSMRKEAQDERWSDVMGIVGAYVEKAELNQTSGHKGDRTSGIHFRKGEPTYGAPIRSAVMTYAPLNEAGVLFLFATVAQELGFSILRLQTEYPDCEAMREVRPGRQQRVHIELEYESRNYLEHRHPLDGCDLIVCWVHNWPECPLEVIELSRIVPVIGGGK